MLRMQRPDRLLNKFYRPICFTVMVVLVSMLPFFSFAQIKVSELPIAPYPFDSLWFYTSRHNSSISWSSQRIKYSVIRDSLISIIIDSVINGSDSDNNGIADTCASVNNFTAFTDETVDNIVGPSDGAINYIPTYASNGDRFLEGKNVYQVIRNNIPALPGVDWSFRPLSGELVFFQNITAEENIMVYYTKAACDIGAIDTLPTGGGGGQDTTGGGGGDGGGGEDTSTVDGPTVFGLNFNSNDITVQQKFDMLTGVYHLKTLRASVIHDTYKGNDLFLDKLVSQGGDSVKAVLTFRWKNVGKDGQGNKVPNRFLQPSEYTAWQAWVTQVMNKYHDIISVFVFENEPTTKRYYYGSVLDYLDGLDMATNFVHTNWPDIPVTDGCVHAGYVQNIMSGHLGDVNTRQVDTIINYYPSIDLDYTNFHTAAKNESSYNENLVGICNYLRANNGGKPILSNEWHVESNNTIVIKQVVTAMRNANVVISCALDPGATSEQGGVTMHVIGTIQMTPVGQAYRDQIWGLLP